jgi:hypothetical protein
MWWHATPEISSPSDLATPPDAIDGDEVPPPLTRGYRGPCVVEHL